MANIEYNYSNIQQIQFLDSENNEAKITYLSKDGERAVYFTDVVPLVNDGILIRDKDRYKGFLTFNADSRPSQVNEFLYSTLRPTYSRFPITKIRLDKSLDVIYEIQIGNNSVEVKNQDVNELIIFNDEPSSDTSELDNLSDNDLRERLVNEIIENPQDPKLILSMSFFDENSSTSANLKEELGSEEAFDLLKEILTELAGEKPKRKRRKKRKRKPK